MSFIACLNVFYCLSQRQFPTHRCAHFLTPQQSILIAKVVEFDYHLAT